MRFKFPVPTNAAPAFILPVLFAAAFLPFNACAATDTATVIRTLERPKKELVTEGPLVERALTSRTFIIDKRYRSMEGPYDMVKMDMSTMLGVSPASNELWWFKGAKIEVLDEKGVPIGPEFMCHLNIDVESPLRRALFPGLACPISRLITFTQGYMEMVLPEGHGIPLSPREKWSVVFQVLNHNRDGEFRCKQRLTLYFLKDEELKKPLAALTFWAPFVAISTTGKVELANTNLPPCMCCLPIAEGKNAPNNVSNGTFVGRDGKIMSGHWIVPTGKNSWTMPLVFISPDFPQKKADIVIHQMWAHVHPFCEEFTLMAHKKGCAPVEVVKSTITQLGGATLGMSKITEYSSAEGVTIPADTELELKVTYNNTSGRDQDSMATMGLMLHEPNWKKPKWVGVAVADKYPEAAMACSLPPDSELLKRLKPPHRVPRSSSGVMIYQPNTTPPTGAAQPMPYPLSSPNNASPAPTQPPPEPQQPDAPKM